MVTRQFDNNFKTVFKKSLLSAKIISFRTAPLSHILQTLFNSYWIGQFIIEKK